MFCGECGTKNENGSKYCESCGALLEEEKEEKKETGKKKKENDTICCEKCNTKNTIDSIYCEKCGNSLKKEKKKLSKKQKVIIVSCFIALILLFSAYKILDNVTSPKNIAKDYIEAIINKDSDKLYNYIEITDDTTFTSKDIFKDIINEKYKNETIENYTIKDTTYSDGKLNATVEFTYTTKEYPQEQTGKINLTKTKDKKYLLFDNWKVSNLNTIVSIIDDYKIEVPKESKVTYGNIEVTKNYLSNEKSERDIYMLPKVFASKTLIEVTLNNGITLEEEVLPSKYRNEVEIELSEDNIKDEEKEKIVSFVQEKLTSIYQNAIDDVKWDNIKNNYENVSDDFQEHYETFASRIQNNYRTLKKIVLKNGNINDIDLTDDGKIKVQMKISYDYTLEYTSYDDEIKTTNKSSYSYMTVTLERGNKGYILYDINALQTSFYS